jgi:hypothetical protein
MAKRRLTPKQIAAGFGGKRRQTAAGKRRRRKRTPSTSRKTRRSTSMPKKKRRSSGGRRRRAGGRRSRRTGGKWSLTKKELLIAGGAALGYGYLQHRASQAKGDEMKWFKDAPVITPAGRAGTAALAGLAAYAVGGVKLAKPVGIGLAFAFLVGFGRRGLQPYDESAVKDVLAGGDEMYLEGSDDQELLETGSLELYDSMGNAAEWSDAAEILDAA